MIRLVAATLAGLYAILYVFGDEARRPIEVSRAEPVGLQLFAGASNPFEVSQRRLHISDISDQEAVRIAMAASDRVRAERAQSKETQLVTSAAAEPTVTASDDAPSYWYVTGSRVNLRGGPGTSNAVIGQVRFGEEAEVLSDADGWYEIRLADGSASGWIFGKFLNAQRPE